MSRAKQPHLARALPQWNGAGYDVRTTHPADVPAFTEYVDDTTARITHPSGNPLHGNVIAACERLRTRGFTVITHPPARTAE